MTVPLSFGHPLTVTFDCLSDPQEVEVVASPEQRGIHVEAVVLFQLVVDAVHS